MNNSVNFDVSHSSKGTLRAPAASPTESRGPFIREMKNNSSLLVLSLCCFKRKTIPGHQNFHGHRPNPSRKPSLCLVYNILDFRAFLAVWALCDRGPLTSPTSLFPWYVFGDPTFLANTVACYFPHLPLPPCPVPLLRLSLLLGLSSLQGQIWPIFQGIGKSSVKVFI